MIAFLRVALLCWLIWSVVVAICFVWRARVHFLASLWGLVGCGLFFLRMLDDGILVTCCTGWEEGRPPQMLAATIMDRLAPVYRFLPGLSFVALGVAALVDRSPVLRFLRFGWRSRGRPLLFLSAGLLLHVCARSLAFVRVRYYPLKAFDIAPTGIEAVLADCLWASHFFGNGVVFSLLAYSALAGRDVRRPSIGTVA